MQAIRQAASGALGAISLARRLRGSPIQGPASPAESSRPVTPSAFDVFDAERRCDAMREAELEAEAKAQGSASAAESSLCTEAETIWSGLLDEEETRKPQASSSRGGKLHRARTEEEKLKIATEALDKLITHMQTSVEKLKKHEALFTNTLKAFLLSPSGDKRLDLSEKQLEKELGKMKDEKDQKLHMVRLALRRILKSPEQAKEIRNYQLEGIQFMALRSLGGNGVLLADEMGLGKTLQIIATLALLHTVSWGMKGVTTGVYCIVCPVPLKLNWQNEISKWCGDRAKCFVYHGTKQERPELRAQLEALVREYRGAFDAGARVFEETKPARIKSKEEKEQYNAKMREAIRLRNEHRPAQPLFIVVPQSVVRLNDEAAWLHSLGLGAVVNDEAHAIKNKHSLGLLKMGVLGRSSWRILLTGTPLSNDVDELFTLLNFVNADFFPKSTPLSSILKCEAVQSEEGREDLIEREQADGVISKLHRLCSFVMKRRLKEQVPNLNLPERREVILFTAPTEKQLDWFRAIDRLVQEDFLKKAVEHVPLERQRSATKRARASAAAPEEAGPGAKKQCRGALLAARATEEELAAVRGPSFDPAATGVSTRSKGGRGRAEGRSATPEPKLAPLHGYGFEIDPVLQRKMKTAWHVQMQIAMDTPLALDGQWVAHSRGGTAPDAAAMVDLSGKFRMLDRLLPRLKAGGHKVLVFSKFLEVLSVLEDYMEERGHRAVRIDGEVKSDVKDANIAAFQADPAVFALLSTTKTGGLGLNLTAADTVILFDSDYNPQVDLQAMDRAHRIGQTRPVLVLRLITPGEGSLELGLLGVAGSKRCVEDILVVEHADDDGESERRRALGRVRASVENLASFVERAAEQREQEADDAALARLLDRSLPLAALERHARGFLVVRRSRAAPVLPE